MILPSKRITATAWVWRLNAKNLIKGIRNNKDYEINIGYSTPLINNLKTKFFKNKEIEKGVGIINFINRIV